MARLSPSGVDRLLELIGDVNGLGTLPAFRSGLLDALQRAVPALYASYNEVGESGTWAFSQPALALADVERWTAMSADHPVLAHMRRTRDGRPRRISDHMDLATFRSTALHREFYGPLGIASQVAFGLPAAPPLVIGVALSRGEEDFSGEEVELLARARPHLIQAYRTAQAADHRERVVAALSRGLAVDGRQVLVLDRDGTVLHAGEEARAALGLAPPADDGVPPSLDRELLRRLDAARAGDGRVDGGVHTDSGVRWVEPDGSGGHVGPAADGRPPAPGPAGRSPLRLLPALDDGLDVLLVDDPGGGMSVARLRALGLTPREAETLRWIALGRTGPEAARAMGVSPRTAGKHLQAVYAKLGVQNRSDASRTAWAAVGGSPGGERGA